MDSKKVFAFVVNNSNARYLNTVRIDEENGKYCLKVSLNNSSYISFTAEINKDDVSGLLDILKPVNEWGSKDSEKRELLDTTWIIYFYYGENTIRANGYKDFPDDYDSVVNEISNWLISLMKKYNIEIVNFSKDDFKKTLANKPHYIFSYCYYLPLSYIYEYITIEEKDNAYFVDSSFRGKNQTTGKVEISKENIDRLLEILEPLIKCDDLKDRSIVNDVCCEMKISYNGINFSAENLFSKAVDFNDVLAKMVEFIIELY